MTLGGHQSDKLTDEDISHQSTLNCHQSTPKLTVAEAGPKSYTHRDERMVICIARRTPKCMYATLRKQSGLDLSTKVLRRILQDAGILNWRSKRRPPYRSEC
jgi:hypothetical protein